MRDNQNRNYKKGFYPFIATQDLENAAKFFKFVADNTDVEWKLDAYSDGDKETFVIVTNGSFYSVEDGSYTAKMTGTQGEKVVDIHSHPGTETQGASDGDQETIKAPNNAVYFQKDGTLHEYDANDKNINTITIRTLEDLEKYINDALKK